MPKQVPGKSYLTLLSEQPEAGEKCGHNLGCWLILFDGKYYGLNNNNQMQKDIWLSSKGASTDLLRWFCYECGNAQNP